MENVKKIIQRDRFCLETVGVELIEIGPGRAKAKLEITPAHLNGLGMVQGGAIFTLADLALAAAANSHGRASVSINGNISYIKAVSQGVLFAEANEESLNNTLATYSIKVTNGEGGLIALMQGTVYRKKETLDSIVKRS